MNHLLLTINNGIELCEELITKESEEILLGGNFGDAVGLQQQSIVDDNNQAQAENILGDALRVNDRPGSSLRANYKVNFNAAESEGPLVLPFLPLGHTFVVTSSLM